MQVVPPSSQAVDRALARVLARPEFALPPDPAWRAALRRFWRRVLERLGDLLQGLLQHLHASPGSWGGYGHVALVLLGTAGVALLVYLGVRIHRRRLRRAGAADATADEAPPRTADEWEALARAEETAGRWREAALALYQAVLHRQAERGALRLDPAKTPGDYRREARRDAVLSPSLEAFLRRFEPVAFGTGRGDAEGYGSLRPLAAALGAHG